MPSCHWRRCADPVCFFRRNFGPSLSGPSELVLWRVGSTNSGRARHFVFFPRCLTLGAFSSLMEHLVDMWPPHRPGEAGSRAPCRAPCMRRGAPWPRCSCAASCAARAPWCAVVRGGGWVALASPNATKSRRSRKRVGPGAIRLNFCGMGQNPCPKAVLCPDSDDKLIFTVKDIMQWHCVMRKALPA